MGSSEDDFIPVDRPGSSGNCQVVTKRKRTNFENEYSSCSDVEVGERVKKRAKKKKVSVSQIARRSERVHSTTSSKHNKGRKLLKPQVQ